MMPRPELSSQLLQTSPRHTWLLFPFGAFTVFKLCPGRSEAGAPGFALSPHQQRCTGRGVPSCLCLLLRLKPMGRRVTIPEPGCVETEDVPKASGTRATVLEPGLGSCSHGQHWGVWVPLLGGSSLLLGMPPKKKHQASPPQAESCPKCSCFSLLWQFPPAGAHLQVLVWLPASSGEAGGEGQRAGASSWFCKTTRFQGWGELLQGEDNVQSVLRVG